MPDQLPPTNLNNLAAEFGVRQPRINQVTKEELIQALSLDPHPLEGGYFKRTYESKIDLELGGKSRKLLTSIYYLLTSDSPLGYMHRNKSDIIHYYHMGSPIDYFIISPNGEVIKKRLGREINKGEQLQLVVPGGYWKASELSAGEFSLISEAVSPGFEYSDNELATKEIFSIEFPYLRDRFDNYINPSCHRVHF